MLDLRGLPLLPSPEDARAIHQAQGLDYDQMMVLSDPKTESAAAYVRIYNNDGSMAEACGNGARCVADRLCRELNVEAVDLETRAGRVVCERLGPWLYRVNMGAPRLASEAIPLARPVGDTRLVELGWPGGDALSALGPASVVNMGNPHAVFFVPDLSRVDAAAWGARIEVHPMFPKKANVTFAKIDARDCVTARVWERGVGVTLACGSAACATLVAASRLGLMERKGTVRLPGGELVIEWRAADDHVLMTGPVQFEGERVLDDALFEAAL